MLVLTLVASMHASSSRRGCPGPAFRPEHGPAVPQHSRHGRRQPKQVQALREGDQGALYSKFRGQGGEGFEWTVSARGCSRM